MEANAGSGQRTPRFLKLWLWLGQLGSEGTDRLIEARSVGGRRLRSPLDNALPQGPSPAERASRHLLAFPARWVGRPVPALSMAAHAEPICMGKAADALGPLYHAITTSRRCWASHTERLNWRCWWPW